MGCPNTKVVVIMYIDTGHEDGSAKVLEKEMNIFRIADFHHSDFERRNLGFSRRKKYIMSGSNL